MVPVGVAQVGCVVTVAVGAARELLIVITMLMAESHPAALVVWKVSVPLLV